MDRASLLARLDQLLELSPGTLEGEERLEDLDGWTSLAVIGFMALANEEFGIVLSPRKISECSTVNDLFRLVTAK